MYTTIKSALFSLALLALSFSVYSQSDTEFWFVAPDITAEHADSPVYLRFTSYVSTITTVTISQPANPSFTPITITIAPNNSNSIDLSSRLALIENAPANTILKKGLLIKSTSLITAYYDVSGHSNALGAAVNTEIFSLKGSAALGIHFITPFQTFYDNENNTLKNDWAAFHIVATENNTTVQITPSTDIVGHNAGITFSILLNKGETYTGQAVSKLATEHPAGTVISSDKPIAITISDDSVLEADSYDLIGDQIVPIERTGTEYIAVSIGNAAVEKLFICGTENQTKIYVNGGSSPIATIQRGETYTIPIATEALYVKTNHPVYALQVTSPQHELAGAILPHLECTGSKKVHFVRPTAEDFAISLVTKAGSENSFTLNGISGIIKGEDFFDVPGTNGQYKALFKYFNTSTIRVDIGQEIKNKNSNFHLAIMNGDSAGTTFKFGYFSSFGKLTLGEDKSICKDQTILLDASEDFDSYLWNTGETSYYIEPNKPGIYWLIASIDSCTFSDSITVFSNPEPILNLGADISFCSNTPEQIVAPSGFSTYAWNSGEQTANITPRASQQYILKVSNAFGCVTSDSINVVIFPIPEPAIYFDQSEKALCKDSLVQVSVYTDEIYNRYLWNNGDSAFYTFMPTNSTYTLDVWNQYGCKESTERELDCSLYINVFNLITPNGDGLNDSFVLKGMSNNKYTLDVYNRWGNLVYQKKAYNNTWKGGNLSDGIYFYSLKHKEGKKEIKGWVEILRTIK